METHSKRSADGSAPVDGSRPGPKLLATEMVASAPLPLAVLDADGAVVASSRSMAANLARPVEELIGRPLRSLVRTGDALLLVEALRAARDRPDSPTSLVIGLDRADGVSARVDLTISALADGWAVYLRPPQLRSDTTLDLGTSARSATISPHRLGSLAQWQLAIHELITLGASPEVILDHVARLVDHHLSATCVITLKGTESMDEADFEKRPVKMMYIDAAEMHVLDQNDFNQYSIPLEDIEEERLYITESLEGMLALIYNDECVGLQLPTTIELDVTECDPSVKGDSATKRTKPAKLETGLIVQVPDYLSQGERIKVDSRTGQFISRC